MNEESGRFVGFSEDIGHSMTYKVLTDDTKQAIYRSRLKLASIEPNARLGSTTQMPDNAKDDSINPDLLCETDKPMAHINIEDLVGRTYLSTPNEDGTRRRLEIVEYLDKMEKTNNQSKDMVRFRARIDDVAIEEILIYNQILEKMNRKTGRTMNGISNPSLIVLALLARLIWITKVQNRMSRSCGRIMR